MSSEKKYIQEGFTAITPYLYGKPELIDFVQKAFDAQVTPSGAPRTAENLHAEIKVGGAPFMIGNGYFADPSMSAAVWIYVPDVDATYQRALKLGAKSVRDPVNERWGDRVAGVKDTSGNTWWIATNKGAPKS
jgi:PhnB protein